MTEARHSKCSPTNGGERHRGVAGGGVRADPSTELIKGEEGKRTGRSGDHKLPPKELQDTGCWDCGGRRGHEHLFLTQCGQLTSVLLLRKVFKHLLQFTICISRIRPEACNYYILTTKHSHVTADFLGSRAVDLFSHG